MDALSVVTQYVQDTTGLIPQCMQTPFLRCSIFRNGEHSWYIYGISDARVFIEYNKAVDMNAMWTWARALHFGEFCVDIADPEAFDKIDELFGI